MHLLTKFAYTAFALMTLTSNAQVSLQEDFNDGIANGWQTWNSGWQVVGGMYQGTNTTPNIPVETYYAPGNEIPAWGDYMVTAEFSFQGGYQPSDVQLLVRYNSPSAHAGCQVVQYGGVTLYAFAQGQGALSPGTTVPVGIGSTYTLKATVQGSQLRCEITGLTNAIITATAVTMPATGTVGLRATHVPAYFDNVTVTNLNPNASRTFVIGFTGFGNSPAGLCSGNQYPSIGDPSLLESGRGITTLLANIGLRGGANIYTAAFAYYNVNPVGCKANPVWGDHREAERWLSSFAPFKSTDRIVLVGHSFGGYRAWLFVEQVKKLSARANALYVADPIAWHDDDQDPEARSFVDQKNLSLTAPDVSGAVRVYRQTGALEGGVVYLSGIKINRADTDFVFPNGVSHTATDDSEIFQRSVLAEVFGTQAYPSVDLQVTLLGQPQLIGIGLPSPLLRIPVTLRNTGSIYADKIQLTGKLRGSTATAVAGIIAPQAERQLVIDIPLVNGQFKSGHSADLELEWSFNHLLDSSGGEVIRRPLATIVYIP